MAKHITTKNKNKKQIKLNRERGEISHWYQIKTDPFDPLIPAPGKLLLAHTAITGYVENHEHVIDEGRIKPTIYHHQIGAESTINKLKIQTWIVILFSDKKDKNSNSKLVFHKPMTPTYLYGFPLSFLKRAMQRVVNSIMFIEPSLNILCNILNIYGNGY